MDTYNWGNELCNFRYMYFRNVEAAYAHLVRGISPISEAYYSIYKKYNNILNSNYILEYSNLNKIGINKYLSLKEITNVNDNWEFWVIDNISDFCDFRLHLS